MTGAETSVGLTYKDNPYYLFDTKGFISNIKELNEAYKKYYPNFQLSYSFKTNYLKAACKAVLDNGGFAEVVSPYELQYAFDIGFPYERIIYNGVIPSETKNSVALGGGIVNVENRYEFDKMARFAEERKTAMKVGLRINFETDGAKSRFGIDIDGEDFSDIMEYSEKSEYIKVVGIHNHIHGKRHVEYWKMRAERMIELAKRYKLSYIDLGGGMWGKMPESLLVQFSKRPNTYEQYGRTIGKLFVEAFPENDVKLIIEPGIGLVGNVLDCVAKVVYFKEIRGKQYVQLNINGAATAFDYCCDANRIAKPFQIIRCGRGESKELEDADIVGTTCIETDILYRGFNGRLSIGDKIVFENIGAYSLVTARQFITPRFGVYDKETGECLRKAEVYNDMFENYLG